MFLLTINNPTRDASQGDTLILTMLPGQVITVVITR